MPADQPLRALRSPRPPQRHLLAHTMLALGIPSRSVHLRLLGALLSGLPSPALGTPGRALPSAVGVAEAQSPGSSLGLGVLRGPGLTSPPSKQAAAQEGVRAWARAVLGRLPCLTYGQRSSPPHSHPGSGQRPRQHAYKGSRCHSVLEPLTNVSSAALWEWRLNLTRCSTERLHSAQTKFYTLASTHYPLQ